MCWENTWVWQTWPSRLCQPAGVWGAALYLSPVLVAQTKEGHFGRRTPAGCAPSNWVPRNFKQAGSTATICNGQSPGSSRRAFQQTRERRTAPHHFAWKESTACRQAFLAIRAPKEQAPLYSPPAVLVLHSRCRLRARRTYTISGYKQPRRSTTGACSVECRTSRIAN